MEPIVGCLRARVYGATLSITLSLLLTGCADREVGPRYAEKTPSDEMRVRRIVRMIQDLEPWPRRPSYNWTSPEVTYSKEAWARLIHAAELLQQTDPVWVERALREYIRLNNRPPDGVTDKVGEWTKALLLLRVMFDLPEKEVDQAAIDKYGVGVMPFSGFAPARPYLDSCDPNDPEFANVPVTYAMPITWTAQGPRLTSWLGTYNGGTYAPHDEYRFYLKHFPFRKNLARYAKSLREHVRAR